MKEKVSTGETKRKCGAALRLIKPGEAPEPCRSALKSKTARPNAEERALREAAAAKTTRHADDIAPGNKLAYNVREAAEAMGVSPWYVRDEMSLGRLDFSSSRGRKIIPRWELVRYLEKYMKGGTAAASCEEDAQSVSNYSVDSGAPSLKKALSGGKK